MPTPGVTDEQCALPFKLIEHGQDVTDRLCDGEWSFQGRRRYAALLKDGNAVVVPQLLGHRLHVVLADSRASVQEQDRGPVAADPASQLPIGRAR